MELEKEDRPVLTTTQAWSLPGERYLEVLNYQVLHFARYPKTGKDDFFFKWHMAVHNILPTGLGAGDRKQLARMTYFCIGNDEPRSQVLVALPCERFEIAVQTRKDLPLLLCEHQGKKPFRHVRK